MSLGNEVFALLKLILYVALMLIGIVAALFSPVGGAVASVVAYLFNPAAISMDRMGIRFQQYTTVAFLLGMLMHLRKGLPHKGREGLVVVSLWIFIIIAAGSAAWAVISSEEALNAVYELFKSIVVATLLL